MKVLKNKRAVDGRNIYIKERTAEEKRKKTPLDFQGGEHLRRFNQEWNNLTDEVKNGFNDKCKVRNTIINPKTVKTTLAKVLEMDEVAN